jgi:hypothetical protein
MGRFFNPIFIFAARTTGTTFDFFSKELLLPSISKEDKNEIVDS